MQTIPIPFLYSIQIWRAPNSRFPKKVHHNSTSHNKLGKCLTYGLIVPFCIKDFERSLKSSPGGYLLLCHNCWNFNSGYTWTSTNCLLQLWQRKENGCIANTFFFEFKYLSKEIMIMTSLFMLQHISMRSCAYLSLLVLLNTNASLVFIIMFWGVSWWH